MSHYRLHFPKLFALLATFMVMPGCSLTLDFDALTNGAGGDPGVGDCVNDKCLVRATKCHSVYVTSDETYAYVTHFLNDTMAPGLYRLDLSNKGASGITFVDVKDNNAGAGIAGNDDWVVFATNGDNVSKGKVYKVPTKQATGTALGVMDYGNPFGVGLSLAAPTPTVYWADDLGSVLGANGNGMTLGQWKLPNKTARYVAAHGSFIYATVVDTTNGVNQVQVLRLENNLTFTTLVDSKQLMSVDQIQGLTVATLERSGDKKPVPHIFFVTSVGAVVAWESASAMNTYEVLMLNGTIAFDKPGEIVVDDMYAYWTMRVDSGEAGGVYRRSLTDLANGVTETISDMEKNPIGITLVGSSVYWCSRDGLFRYPR